MNEVFQIRGEWKLVFDGVVPPDTWSTKGAAEAQFGLLKSGYSVIAADGTIRHPGAAMDNAGKPGIVNGNGVLNVDEMVEKTIIGKWMETLDYVQGNLHGGNIDEAKQMMRNLWQDMETYAINLIGGKP